MSGLDARLLALRGFARDWGRQLRGIAEEVAADRAAIERHVQLPVLRYLATAMFTADDASEPLRAGGHEFHLDTVLDQVVFFEELARGDVGTLMAAPGAPLAGPLVALLGDADQRRGFTDRLASGPTWTFFGLTEPDHGSDAAAMSTELVADGARLLLRGGKKFVGNAPRSQLGVVFARRHPGPLGLRAVLLDVPAPGLTITSLDTLGLPGALLGRLDFADVPVDPTAVLGEHLPATRRGAYGWTRVFNRLRPRVAAMAVGLAAAAHDHVSDLHPRPTAAVAARLDELAHRIEGVRRLVRRAAVAVDADAGAGHLASAAKARAARVAEEVTLAAEELAGPGARLDDPVLDALVRDARGLEFMEGAGNIQLQAVAHQVVREHRRAV